MSKEQTLKHSIALLESQLQASQAQLNSLTDLNNAAPNGNQPPPSQLQATQTPPTPLTTPPHPLPNVPPPLPSHPLLLLSDSALPLGSFAFSSGLESYLAHHNSQTQNRDTTFPSFLTLSLTSLATTNLPYLLAAYRDPVRLQELDETLDACTLCPVARRASVAQGKALLTLWERALRGEAAEGVAKQSLAEFARALKGAPAPSAGEEEVFLGLSGHFAPIWAVVTSAMAITVRESTYTFLLNHAKAVVSAGVRASVMGPYAAQGMLASTWLRKEIESVMNECWDMKIEDAGQSVPMCDLWVGRHEMLYSRIFNS